MHARIIDVNFEKLEPEKYVRRVDGCVFAEKCHDLPKPKDVASIYALIVMAIFQ